MARKPKPKQPPAPAAPQGAYADWLKRVGALLERQGISPNVMRPRDWRDSFISGASPEQAAERAGVELHNTRPPFGRKRSR